MFGRGVDLGRTRLLIAIIVISRINEITRVSVRFRVGVRKTKRCGSGWSVCVCV